MVETETKAKIDYSKECWYCHGKMKPAGGYYFCTSCGATWNRIIETKSMPNVHQPWANGLPDPLHSDANQA